MHLSLFPSNVHDELIKADRSIVTYAAGVVIGRALALPGAAVESAPAHFQNAHHEMAQRIAGIFNEVRIIDIDTVVEIASQVWLGRYAIVHGLEGIQNVGGRGLHNSTMTLFGADYFIAEKHTRFLIEHCADISDLVFDCMVASKKAYEHYAKPCITV